MIFNFKHAKTLEGRRAKDFVPNCETLSTSILEKALEVGIGIHNYHIDGGNYTGNDLPTTATNQYIYSSATIIKRKSNSITVVLWGAGYYQMKLNNYSSNGWHGWVGFLPIDGGGRVTKDGASPLELESTSATSVWESFYSTLGYLGRLGFSAKETPAFMTTGGGVKELLHTGNKPSGTYTGNGTARTITTGGVGGAVLIRQKGATNHVIVDASGYFGAVNGKADFGSGISLNASCDITLASDSVFNTSGVAYEYHVL